jgi:tight adherence protein B
MGFELLKLEHEIAIILFVLIMTLAMLLYAGRRSEHREQADKLLHRLGYGYHALPDYATPDHSHRPPAVPGAISMPLAYLDRVIAQTGLTLDPRLLFVLTAVIFVAVSVIAAKWFHLAMAFGTGALAASLPILYLQRLRRRRLRSIGEQLPYMLDLLKSGMQSGHTLLRGLQMASENLPEPIAGEIHQVTEQVRVGMVLPQALESLYIRVPVDEIGFLIAAVNVQAEVGSSLAEILQHVSDSIRNRQRLDQQIRTLTAQSRASAFIVTLLPAVVLGAFSLVRADYAWPLFHDPTGIKMLETAIVLDLTALFTMRRIMRMDY